MMAFPTRFLCGILALLAVLDDTSAVFANPIDMNLAAQLAAIEDELRDKMAKDPPLMNQKLKFGKVVNENLPESSFELRLEEELRERLADLLSNNGVLTLSASYDYVTVDAGENQGHKVIQITLTIKNAARRELLQIVREVNNTGDIARILGSTLAPPDTKQFEVRNDELEKAQAEPQFATHPRRSTAVTAKGQNRYALELRKRIAGQGRPVAVPPSNVDGRAFAEIDHGDTYEVVLLNFDETYDAVVKLEIDGLDTANTFNSDGVSYPGYFIPRAKDGEPGIHVVPGWLHTIQRSDSASNKIDNVFEFVVNELGKGAASSKSVRSSIGVVTARFFDAASPDEKMRSRFFGETGKGKGMQVDYGVKQVQMSTQPLSIISIRYTRSPE